MVAKRRMQALPVAEDWFGKARRLRSAGRHAAAWRADLTGIETTARDPALLSAAMAMHEGRVDAAEAMLRALIAGRPDPAATRLLGELAWRRGDMPAALALVEQALDLAPGFDLARDFLIRLLLQNNRLADALRHAEILVGSPARQAGYDLVLASVLVRLGHQPEAAAIYRRLLAAQPDQPQVWQNLGHVLKTLGDQAEAIAAYRQAVARRPRAGEAWWSLANLKTLRFDAADIAAMRGALNRVEQSGAAGEDAFHLHFALGKAFEDGGDAATAFAHYASANARRRAMLRHDADAFSAEARETAEVFSAPFLNTMGAGGTSAADPIFIVGLPRAGSTLIEQILASHSQVEGTMELPELMTIAGRLQSRVDDGEYPDIRTLMASLDAADRRRLGEEYLDRTRIHRRSDRPFFIDKLPNNWQHVGLIQLILPNAGIVDARRHPMACCFSAWKQHFARGQAFTYDLAEIGRYYCDYVALMARFDAAMPGRVHRIFYERMVADMPGEVARLLGALGLPFEPQCLAFWENKRAIRTASSEQVRLPIFTDAVDHWRRYEAYLGSLVEAVGPVAQAYPAVPAM